ncbi:hypothetical protein LH464_23345 [Neorhizobium sp. T786]|uniref:polymorphic toxin type 33 domain-containing protein n=1 Tax=Pseudorhizobium xiangyangii TaxID=2883104 RepID=UPI001CFFFC9B|nr:polymorphic toxin type 33 domain-containing protein [Neorhizobium xiangyangii]MCB5205400.1 hypothetical protein [Neorhizobium xiangyangii]
MAVALAIPAAIEGLLWALGIGASGTLAMSSDAREKAEKRYKAAPTTDACLTCTPPPEDDEEKKAKDAKRMSDKELDKAAKKNGFRDAHELKREYRLNSKSDIFAGKDGTMYSGPRQGTGTPRSLGINIHGT